MWKSKAPWFIGQRAEHLAILHLTRRGDLVVTQASTDDGPDILVEISRNNKVTGRIFGVQVKASQRFRIVPDNSLRGDEFKIPIRAFSMPEDLPFPLCLFLFQMENDEGFYRWLIEPIVRTESRPKLLVNEENIFRKLTREELDSIVGQVNNWYENRPYF
ncbi:DUF4365 domain-containing protein [Candidatus Poribacteria bacterium]|nr:DUF4365 domain-containing protein [Candidatus Poribacteria bacterium]